MVTELEHIEALVAKAVISAEEQIREAVAKLVAPCSSPIERVFITALYTEYHVADGVYFYGAGGDFSPPPFEGLHIYPQVKIDGYCLDFLCANMRANGSINYTVIECDGHDFHERTKQQASHDKARDRHFQRKGWKVIRFTGSDIWRGPAGAASDAFEIAIGYGENE